MSSRNLFASILLACLLAAGLGGLASRADAAPAAQTLLTTGKSAQNGLTEIRHRGRGPRLSLRIGPSYSGYDYPYYYNRGYYPTHIGPGYVYHYPIYSYRPVAYPKQGRRCSHWHRKCVANWGYRSSDYQGCMDYHRCD